MAADDFEMETGESFTRWIEKHPQLVMQYQPLELTVRRFFFFFPLFLSLLGLAVFALGIVECAKSSIPSLYLLAGWFIPLGLIVLWFVNERMGAQKWTVVLRFLAGAAAMGIPIYGCIKFGKPFVYCTTGTMMMGLFGALSIRGLQAYLRALNFKLTLKEGTFHLQHGSRSDTFSAEDVTQACVVRPGTVGATEGALRLQDGRMLTLDTCLSDLHALGVVMDLRFRSDFPPSADDLAKVRRDKLRKIRGLS
jgi:hypothetical protein